MSIYEERFTACVQVAVDVPATVSVVLHYRKFRTMRFRPKYQFLISGTRQAISEHGVKPTHKLVSVFIRMAADEGNVWKETEAFNEWVKFWRKNIVSRGKTNCSRLKNVPCICDIKHVLKLLLMKRQTRSQKIQRPVTTRNLLRAVRLAKRQKQQRRMNQNC